MSRIIKALELSSTLAASFVAWNAERIACATRNVIRKNGSGRQLDIPVLEASDELTIARNMKSNRPFVFRYETHSRDGLHDISTEQLAAQDEPLNICAALADGTFSYGCDFLVHMSAREFVDRVFNGRQTRARLYLRFIDESIVKHDVPERLGDYQYVRGSNHVFISQAGCVTRLHYDAGHGMLTQFKGTKKITLFAPDQGYNLYENPVRFARLNEFSSLPQADCMQADPDDFKRLASIDRFEGVLRPGDTLYIPAYWWHQVATQTPSISGVVMYHLHEDERLLAREFSTRLQKILRRTRLVKAPVCRQCISRELQEYYSSSPFARTNADIQNEPIFDL